MNTDNEIRFEVVASQNLSASVREEILHLCTAAYEEDFRPYLDVLQNPVHLLAWRCGALVSHAAWVTRWLQVNGKTMLRTAYVEAVATLPAHQRQGLASAVMQQLVKHLADFDIAALSPSEVGFYARFGWELWRGQLAVRTEDGNVPTPDEEVMIYRLPRTPELDLTHLLTIEWRPGDEVW
jgi:aminoglycoside 2'-N-acetyltransferase I